VGLNLLLLISKYKSINIDTDLPIASLTGQVIPLSSFDDRMVEEEEETPISERA